LIADHDDDLAAPESWDVAFGVLILAGQLFNSKLYTPWGNQGYFWERLERDGMGGYCKPIDKLLCNKRRLK